LAISQQQSQEILPWGNGRKCIKLAG